MSPVYVMIKELEMLRIQFFKFGNYPSEEIKAKFHDEITLPLKSLVARAENMEISMKELI